MSETNIVDEPPSLKRRGMPIWVQVIVWVVLLTLLAVMAYGLKLTQQGSVKIGDALPGFTLNLFNDYTIQNKPEIALADLKGKVVVLNFWASWCLPCQDEAAELESAWKFYKPGGKVVFLGIDYVDTEPEALNYLKKFGISYANGPDLQTRISQIFRISGVPETYIVDQNGKLVGSQIGPFTSEAQIHALIDPLLK